MVYELWTGNHLLGDFASEEAALAIVRQTVQRHGSASISFWILLYEDAEDESKDRGIAAGESLLKLMRSDSNELSRKAKTG